jgi:RNA polymerase sigma-70 factor (ECF subfamily)
MTGDHDAARGSQLTEHLPEIRGLVDQCLPALFAYAYRLTGSADEAEDLTQQTFLIAQQKIHQLREAEKARAWLLKILRNCYLKNRRRNRPLVASELELDINQFGEVCVPERPWDPERLQRALDELPEMFRTVVLMFYFEQLSYQEIADQLDVPLGTVMSRLSRGKHHLRRKLERHQPQTT